MIRRIDNKSPWPDNLFYTMFSNGVQDITFEELATCLDPRTKTIIEHVFKDHMTQKDVAKEFEVSSERIRQIIMGAIRKLQHQTMVIEYRKEKEAELKEFSERFDPDDPEFVNLMDLSARAYNCLVRSKIYSMNQIADLICNNTIWNVRNLGKVSGEEIIQKFDVVCKKVIEGYSGIEPYKVDPKIQIAYDEFQPLEIQTRAINSLVRADICTIKELVESFDNGRIYDVSDLGLTSIRSLHKALKEKIGMRTIV